MCSQGTHTKACDEGTKPPKGLALNPPQSSGKDSLCKQTTLCILAYFSQDSSRTSLANSRSSCSGSTVIITGVSRGTLALHLDCGGLTGPDRSAGRQTLGRSSSPVCSSASSDQLGCQQKLEECSVLARSAGSLMQKLLLLPGNTTARSENGH